jgi:hypothetical protein
MLFNVMISRFFTTKQRENREKQAGKRETATTLIEILISRVNQESDPSIPSKNIPNTDRINCD